jgi:hypothetical protein
MLPSYTRFYGRFGASQLATVIPEPTLGNH